MSGDVELRMGSSRDGLLMNSNFDELELLEYNANYPLIVLKSQER